MENKNIQSQSATGKQDTEFGRMSNSEKARLQENLQSINPVAMRIMQQDQEGRRPDSNYQSNKSSTHPTEEEVWQSDGQTSIQAPTQGGPNHSYMNDSSYQNTNNTGSGRNEAVNENGQTLSYRGRPIPIVEKKQSYTVANSDEVINKAKSMAAQEREIFTIVGIHLDNKRISEVKLSTGEVIDVETAIALADSDYLRGYTTGATMRGGKTLRTKPSPDDSGMHRIYDLPRF